MKKTILKSMIATMALAGFVILGQQAAHAGIKGQVCATCHTMHNSESGTTWAGNSTTPRDRLLVTSCLGCHSDTSQDAMLSSNQAPVVYHSGGVPSKYLAGGDFYWALSDTGKGHNPWELKETQTADGVSWDDVQITLAEGPPGNDATSIFITNTNYLGCVNYDDGAGKVAIGCHVYNAHHSNKGGADGSTDVYWVDGSTDGESYRFLYGGIKGGEMGNWEYTGTTAADKHNLYFGGSSTTFATTKTISRFCGECHGNFHGGMGASQAEVDGNTGSFDAPWVRHPTDYPLSDAPAAYQAYGTYDPDVPIGTDTKGGDATSGTALTMSAYDAYDGTDLDIVLCVSCHRVHGSANDNILRWDYSTMVAASAGAATGKGCFKCHTDKD